VSVNIVYLPPGPNGEKVGVDDYLLTHTPAELEALVQAPRPTPKAAEPQVELLAEPPAAITRPLALVDGCAYVATWLWIKKTVTESLSKDGDIVRHDPPIVSTERKLFVIRGDGTVFGPGGDEPLGELGIEVKLPEALHDAKVWRAAALAVYRAGRRPDAASVFARIGSVYDRFIDFARSFADQPSMCELSACFSLATWFTPAFSVLGYPWPTGERGCGKTHWGTCWAETSYLGEVLLSSGSFAALRDLAEYGAALLFDDAEVLSNPKKADPAKRELLLAGNRRGARVPLKEPKPNGGWEIRWCNAFCPRGFTSIRVPDHVLRSRSILIPLARTADPRRGNADPADEKRWPCDKRQLQDDCWALGLWLLPEAAENWAELDSESGTTGREFEPLAAAAGRRSVA
jgi:hypothetical protein